MIKPHSISGFSPMSKYLRLFLILLSAFIQILHFFNNSNGQTVPDLIARIRITKNDRAVAEVSGSFDSDRSHKNPRNISFINDYGGVSGLGERISNVVLTGRNGDPIANKRFAAGEYVADSTFLAWNYRVDLTPLRQRTAAAHVSWISADTGLLMIDDLVPQAGIERVSVRVKLEVPAGWSVFANSPRSQDGDYEFRAVEKASFLIGRDLRDRQVTTNGTKIHFVTSGEWQFTDAEAAGVIEEVFGHYASAYGLAPSDTAQIAIVKFPVDTAPGNWEGDTRGNTVTIVSSDMPFKTQSLQRLHEQLRHEVFHLWFPNGVNLSGNYDWFYEGFGLYQSLKLGVAVNRLRFTDFLDSLAQAYNIENSRDQGISLIEASSKRWSGESTRLYARGMLVAFVTDLALLQQSKGKISAETLLRAIYQKYHGAAQRDDGTAAVLSVMKSYPELNYIVSRFITGAEKFGWETELNAAGIEAATSNSFTALNVTAKPNKSQRDLLDKLGYNSWRKLEVKGK